MIGWKISLPRATLAGFFALGILGLLGTGVAQAEARSQYGANSGKQGQNEQILLTVELEEEGTVVRRLSLRDLQALGVASFETQTIWTTGPQQFTGVPLATLVAALKPAGTSIEARAVNDYMVEIPLSDAVPGGALVAYERNGKTMSLRDKGPLWLVYPYDSNPAYRTEAVYSRSIWQLDTITMKTSKE
ncbi:molybdopterin-dependent oxidoreductase [Pseudophaeobacter sp.]|uniref:molybdopterin-dependent oxidoreductase n=1 Tax=Pseudophaeobacter sp. TaxID=1971739 RepID=UPI003298BF56